MKNITGVIMAGGKSSRMGTDKGLVHFKGKRLVEYAIETLNQQCCELLISTSNPNYARFGFDLVPDEIPGCGPIGGIYSSLKASKTEQIIVLACDMPFVTSEILNLLISESDKYDCVVPEINGKLEPLCAIYSRSMIPLFEKHLKSTDFALYKLITNSNCKMIKLGVNNISAFTNFNTTDELENS